MSQDNSTDRQPYFHREPGVNVDHIDVGAGLAMLRVLGWDDPKTRTVVEIALRMWARGEETAAQRKATDRDWHGISLTSWYAVLAAAQAAGEQAAAVAGADD